MTRSAVKSGPPAPPAELYTRKVMITPAFAADALNHFMSNRHSSADPKYARDMATGNWRATGDTLKCAPDGTWLDGMQRFKAVIASGVTVEMLVAYNVDKSAVPNIDSGRPRGYRDTLQIREVPNARELAALARRMFDWDRGDYWRVGGGFTPSYAELDSYIEDHPELHRVAQMIAHHRPPLVPATAYGVCYTVFGRISASSRDSFCDAWLTGTGMEAGDPVYALRERIIREKSQSSYRGANTRSEIPIALACVAWNCYRNGIRITKLQLPKDGLSSKRYPVPR